MHSLLEVKGPVYLSGVSKEACLQTEERQGIGRAFGFVSFPSLRFYTLESAHWLITHIAQVEVLLKDAAGKTDSTRPDSRPGDEGNLRAPQESSRSVSGSQETSPFDNGTTGSFNWTPPPASAEVPFNIPDMQYQPRTENAGATSYELLGFGLFEALPPAEMIEEL